MTPSALTMLCPFVKKRTRLKMMKTRTRMARGVWMATKMARGVMMATRMAREVMMATRMAREVRMVNRMASRILRRMRKKLEADWMRKVTVRGRRIKIAMC